MRRYQLKVMAGGCGDAMYTLLNIPDSKVHGATMGPIWGRQDTGGPNDGPMNFAVWDCMHVSYANGRTH